MIDAILVAPEARRFDKVGNPIAIGRDRVGQPIEVVIAFDDLGYVITVIERRKRR